MSCIPTREFCTPSRDAALPRYLKSEMPPRADLLNYGLLLIPLNPKP